MTHKVDDACHSGLTDCSFTPKFAVANDVTKDGLFHEH